MIRFGYLGISPGYLDDGNIPPERFRLTWRLFAAISAEKSAPKPR